MFAFLPLSTSNFYGAARGFSLLLQLTMFMFGAPKSQHLFGERLGAFIVLACMVQGPNSHGFILFSGAWCGVFVAHACR